jgi:hypothetical protein
VSALLLPLAAVSGNGTKIFFALTVLNAAIYGAMYFCDHDRPLARHLAFASVVMLMCGLPGEWIYFLTPTLERQTYIGAGIAVYLMLYNLLSRNPKAGILGSILVALIVGVLFSRHDSAIHWALQGGLVFLLLHSLRWDDSKHQGARAVRFMAAGLWVLHAAVWAHLDAALWMPCISGAIVLAAYLITQLLRGRWDTFILPAASILTVLSGPGNALVLRLQSAPSGLLAVAGSFLLFALGTAAALTKHHWHKTSA